MGKGFFKKFRDTRAKIVEKRKESLDRLSRAKLARLNQVTELRRAQFKKQNLEAKILRAKASKIKSRAKISGVNKLPNLQVSQEPQKKKKKVIKVAVPLGKFRVL